MKQKLTQMIQCDLFHMKQGVFPIKTKREALFHVRSANMKKAARSRKRVASIRAEAEKAKEQDAGREAA